MRDIDIASTHMIIMRAVRQLSEYDKIPVWDDNIKSIALKLCDDIEHYANVEHEYYRHRTGRTKNQLIEKIFPKENE